jgi:hypothetical protein
MNQLIKIIVYNLFSERKEVINCSENLYLKFHDPLKDQFEIFSSFSD